MDWSCIKRTRFLYVLDETDSERKRFWWPWDDDVAVVDRLSCELLHHIMNSKKRSTLKDGIDASGGTKDEFD